MSILWNDKFVDEKFLCENSRKQSDKGITMPNNQDYQPPKLDLSAPPAYSRVDYNQPQTVQLPPINENDASAHGKLPTYEEVQVTIQLHNLRVVTC